jgi:hypothetical protein
LPAFHLADFADDIDGGADGGSESAFAISSVRWAKGRPPREELALWERMLLNSSITCRWMLSGIIV